MDIIEILNNLSLESNIKLEEVPEIDLYMDQVIQLFESKLSNQKRNDEEKILTKTMINNYAKSKGLLKKDEEALSGDDVREGLTAIISVKHPDPQYEGQTKTKLGNAEVRKIASNIISASLDKFLLDL